MLLLFQGAIILDNRFLFSSSVLFSPLSLRPEIVRRGT